MLRRSMQDAIVYPANQGDGAVDERSELQVFSRIFEFIFKQNPYYTDHRYVAIFE